MAENARGGSGRKWVLGIVGGLIAAGVYGAIFGDGGEARRAAEAEAAKPQELASLAAYLSALNALTVPCDAAQARVGAALQDFAGTDRVALAGDVAQMERACSNAWLNLDDITRPDGLTGDQSDRIDAMEDVCNLAFHSRKGLAEQLIPIVDGDLRPSVMAALREEMEYSAGQTQECGAAIAALAAEPVSE